MNKLILIRHAQSEHHIAKTTGGWTDNKLTETGKKQAELLAEKIKKDWGDEKPLLFSSDLRRAKHTAEIIGRKIGIQPEYDRRLRELNTGLAAGKSKEQAEELKNPVTEPLVEWRPYKGAENWLELYGRAAGFLDSLQDLSDVRIDRPVLIVAHLGTIINIINRHLGIEPDLLYRLRISFDADPASISVLRTNEWGEKTIALLNDTWHL